MALHPRVILAPVMEIRPVAFELPERAFDFLVLTSRHAVAAAQPYQGLPALCVGEATAQAAREAGFETPSVFANAEALLAGGARYAGQRALYLHGRHTRGRLAERLNSAEIATEDRVVYDQVACDWPPQICEEIMAQPALILPLYSPRSARLVAENLVGFTGKLTLVGLSEACLEGWTGPAPVTTVVAARPDGAAMKMAIASQLP